MTKVLTEEQKAHKYAYMKVYRQLNKERIREYKKEYREKHKEEIKEYNKWYRYSHGGGKQASETLQRRLEQRFKERNGD